VCGEEEEEAAATPPGRNLKGVWSGGQGIACSREREGRERERKRERERQRQRKRGREGEREGEHSTCISVQNVLQTLLFVCRQRLICVTIWFQPKIHLLLIV